MTNKLSSLEIIPAGPVHIEGMLELPADAQGIVLFAHGSGSSRHSPRNRYVAGLLQQAGLGTLLLDLLTPGVRGQQKAVAEELGITTQAVSKAVARAQWNEEHAARPAAARLLGLILEVR